MTAQQDLDRAVAAARGIKPPVEHRWRPECLVCDEPQAYCRVCDELLMISRREVGLCWACQFRQEARDRRDYEEGA